MLRKAFTLVELLVVIAIIGILIGLLLPAINSARESGRRAACANHIRQLALACNNFCNTNGRFPEGMTVPKGEAPETTWKFGPNWVIKILPFMEGNSLYNRFDLSPKALISDPKNAMNVVAKSTQLDTMLCPSDSVKNTKPYIPGSSRGGTMGKDPWARGNYGANSAIAYLNVYASQGPGGIDTHFEQGAGAPGFRTTWARGVMGCNVGATPQQIPDGLAHTALICELRAGVVPFDHRGTWALGECGGSTLWGFGCCGNGGVNVRAYQGSDDLFEGGEVYAVIGDMDAMDQNLMGVWSGGDSWQAGCKSRHPGGANIAMCDGSVYYINENIEANQDCSYTRASLKVWEFLMAAGDGFVAPANKWQ
jgi:prepilin-type N-terminal cleavage/methylation domain-containing protein/prepilin-type processing-associated H-X9-DG protein